VSAALVFRGGNVILPTRIVRDGVVVCRDGRIEAVGGRSEVEIPADAVEIEARGRLVGPGYVDIHVHGGGGADFMDGRVSDVVAAALAHARHGTTTLFPTTTTGSPDQLRAMLSACVAVRKRWRAGNGARLAGVHFYGPYFAADRVGCHSLAGRRDPNPREYTSYFDLGVVRIATCAAELPGSEDYYREASSRGYLVTCGHSDASWNEMARAFRAGMRHVDHFWCAMSSVPSVAARLGTPMQGSMAEFVLMNEETSTEVIADGCHLAPELLEFAFRFKGPELLCLVTDSSRALDMPPGRYRFGPQEDGEWFESDGAVGFQADRLASSVTGMDRMVRNMVALTSASVADAVRMASLTPAERAGIAGEVGSLEPSKRADVLLLSPDLEVERVFVGGEELSD
jgi:N-acetylglucosamine-6-phosphate deacetylase